MCSIWRLWRAVSLAASVFAVAVLSPAAVRAAPAVVVLQGASVVGTVTDGSGNALAGATVRVPAAGRGVVTDADGRFRINDLAAGEHTLTVMYIGYSDATRTVRLGAGESAVVEIVMEASAVALGGITVYGELTRGQARALNEQKTSPNLKYVIDEELFDMDLYIRLDGRRQVVGQIYRQIRDAVIDGRLRAGDGLPSSRALARRLEVSRNTVVVVYERLRVEGFLEREVPGRWRHTCRSRHRGNETAARRRPCPRARGCYGLSPLVARIGLLRCRPDPGNLLEITTFSRDLPPGEEKAGRPPGRTDPPSRLP